MGGLYNYDAGGLNLMDMFGPGGPILTADRISRDSVLKVASSLFS